MFEIRKNLPKNCQSSLEIFALKKPRLPKYTLNKNLNDRNITRT